MNNLPFYPFSSSTASALKQLEEAEAGREAAEVGVAAGTPALISDNNNNNNIGNDNDDVAPVAETKE